MTKSYASYLLDAKKQGQITNEEFHQILRHNNYLRTAGIYSDGAWGRLTVDYQPRLSSAKLEDPYLISFADQG